MPHDPSASVDVSADPVAGDRHAVSFATVRRGYDPLQVDDVLVETGHQIESLQLQIRELREREADLLAALDAAEYRAAASEAVAEDLRATLAAQRAEPAARAEEPAPSDPLDGAGADEPEHEPEPTARRSEPTAATTGAPTDGDVAVMVGEETTRIVDAARHAAIEIGVRAREEAEQIVAAAREEARSIRADAEVELLHRTREADDAIAARLLEAADAVQDAKVRAEAIVADGFTEAATVVLRAREEAAEVVAAGEQRGAELAAAAEAARDDLLVDLVRRRKVLRSQVEQLEAGRVRLRAAYTVVEESLAQATDELDRTVGEARDAAVAAGARAAAQDDPEVRAAAEALGADADALVARADPDAPAPAPAGPASDRAEVEAHDGRGAHRGSEVAADPTDQPAEVPDADLAAAVETDVAAPTDAATPIEAAAPTAPPIDAAAPTGAPADVEVPADAPVALEDDPARPAPPSAADAEDREPEIDLRTGASPSVSVTVTATGAPAPAASVTDAPSAVEPAVDEPSAGSAGDADPGARSAAPTADEPAARRRRRRAPDPVEFEGRWSSAVRVLPPSHRAGEAADSEAAAVPSVGAGRAATSADEVFARLRAGGSHQPSLFDDPTAAVPAPVDAVEPALDDAAGGTDPEEAWIARRDAALAPALRALRRRLKATLADDEDSLLEAIRRAPSVPASVDPLRDADARRGDLAVALGASIAKAAAAGAELARVEVGATVDDGALDDLALEVIAGELADAVVAPLDERLDRCIARYHRTLADAAGRGSVGVDDVDAAAAAVDDATREAAMASLVSSVKAAYRARRGAQVQVPTEHAILLAGHRGLVASLEPGTPLRWVVAPPAPPSRRTGGAHPASGAIGSTDQPGRVCASCVAVADVGAGDHFGHGPLLPPARPGCRCAIAPVSAVVPRRP